MSLNEHLMRLGIHISRAFSLFSHKDSLHHARFAEVHELSSLISPAPVREDSGLLLGRHAFNHVLSVRPSPKRSELGNMLVVAPPRAGKSILATSQLLTWPHSVIVNDIKASYSETPQVTAQHSAKYLSLIQQESDTASTRPWGRAQTSSLNQLPKAFFTNPMKETGRSSPSGQYACSLLYSTPEYLKKLLFLPTQPI